MLSGGRGQLLDGVVGHSDWQENAGLEWVGWDGSQAVSITFQFEGETLLGKVMFSSNNDETNGVRLFERVECSVGGSISDAAKVLDVETTWWERTVAGLVIFTADLSGYRGSLLHCVMYPAGRWLLLSEVQFQSGCDIALGLSTGAVRPEQISATTGETRSLGLRSDCYFGRGQAYRGNVSVTQSQVPCQPWSLQSPHAHPETPLNYPDGGLDGNYCRNPGGMRERPWCYTNGTDAPWDFCSMPACGSWAFYLYTVGTHITVDFTRPVQISKMAMAGNGYYWTSALEVAYSMDNTIWDSYIDSVADNYTLQGNTDAESITFVTFLPKITARFISVIPKTSEQYYSAMNVEFFGCSSDKQSWSSYTNVTENIVNDKVWSLANNPFFIHGDITVTKFAKLTIQPGVKVVFSFPTSRLTIQGELFVNGQPGLPVNFGPSGIPLTSGQWYGIVINADAPNKKSTIRHAEFVSCSVCVTAQSSNVDIDQVRIHKAVTGLQFEDPSNVDHTVIINNTRVTNSNDGIKISARNGDFHLFSVSVIDNANAGVYLTNMASMSVAECNFKQNAIGILYFVNSPSSLNVINCQISQQRNYGMYVYGYGTISFLVKNSLISGNGNGLYLRGSVIAVLEDNLFTNNSFYGLSIYNDNHMSLVNNVIQNNAIASGQACLITSSSYMSIDGNLFNGNKGQIQFTGGPFPANITNNVFRGNDANQRSEAAVAIDLLTFFANNTLTDNVAPLAAVAVSSYASTVTFNVFSNPSCPYEMKCSALYEIGAKINAHHNYWGVPEELRARARILDFSNDLALGVVEMLPLFQDPGLSVHIGSPGETVFTGNFTGGAIRNGSLNLPRGNYFITSNILVEPASVLSLSSGASLTFMGRTGMRIEGKLIIGSPDEEELSKLSADSVPWHGIICNNCEEMTLQQVEITNFEMFQVSGTSISMTNVKVKDSRSGLTFLSSQKYSVMHLTFENCTFSGILSDAINMNMWNYYFLLNISKSTFTNFGRSAVVINNAQDFTIEISSSYFTAESSSYALSLNSYNWYTISNCRIVDSVFVGGLYGVYISITRSNLEVSGNLIRGFSQNALSISDSGAHSYIHVHGNTFEHNHGDFVIQMSADHEANYTFYHNDLTNNSATTSLIVQGASPTLHYNYFENPEATFEISARNGNSQQYVDATLNWWGQVSDQSVAARINDESSAEVVFFPFLVSRNVSDLSRTEDTVFLEAGVLGGVVKNHTVIPYVDGGYEVIRDITVEASATLTLEPGVQLRFHESVLMEVKGQLLAVGNKSHFITLTNVASTLWRGLIINSKTPIEIGKEPYFSVLQHLIITNSRHGLKINNSTILLESVSSTNNEKSGLTLMQPMSNLRIVNGTFSSNGEYGIVTEIPDVGSDAVVTAEGVTASKNKQGGIMMHLDFSCETCNVSDNAGVGLNSNRQVNIALNNSFFKHNALYQISTNSISKLLLINSMIGFTDLTKADNTQYYYEMVFITGPYYVGSSVTIKNNTFTRVVQSIKAALLISGVSATCLQQNRFTDINSPSLHLEITYTKSSAQISENTFERVVSTSHVMMLLQYRDMFSFTFSANTLVNCSGETAIDLNPQTSIGSYRIQWNVLAGGVFTRALLVRYVLNMTVSENVFQNPGSAYEVSVDRRTPGQLVELSNNYWGSSDPYMVQRRILDFHQDSSLEVTTYSPFYVDSSLSALSNVTGDFWTDPSLPFGGILDADYTLEPCDGVKVNRSILVRSGNTLTIPPGCELQFSENRGLVIEGSLHIRGSSEEPVVLSSITGRWHGLALTKIPEDSCQASFDGQVSVIQHLRVLNATNGIAIFHSQVDLRFVHVDNSLSTGLFLTVSCPMTQTVRLEHVVVSRAAKGMTFTGPELRIFITESSMSRTESYGLEIHSWGQRSEIDITASTFSGKHGNVIDGNGALTLSNVTVSESSAEYGLKVLNSLNVIVYDSTFRNNSAGGIYFENCATVRVTNSNFESNTGREAVYFNSYYIQRDLYLVDNVFTSNVMDLSSSKSLITIIVGYMAENIAFSLSGNEFQNNAGTSIVSITCSYRLCTVGSRQGVTNNNFQQNVCPHTGAVVKVENVLIGVERNIFNNVENADYDLWVSLNEPGHQLNATENSWSVIREVDVVARIKNPEYVLWKPFLKDLNFSCEGVNNCSGSGACTWNNQCRCYPGHAGAACEKFVCDNVQQCNRRGRCVGPNWCLCDEGWTGAACTDVSCGTLNNCSGRGVCYAPESCLCYRYFAGPDCSICQDGFWGPSCLQCPLCVHGHCDLNTGRCVCSEMKWAGNLCDRCAEGLYGSDCLPVPTVLDVIPSTGPDVGGTLVLITGRNLNASADGGYRCAFGDQVVEGTWLSSEQVRCVTPMHAAGAASVNVAPGRGGQSSFTASTVLFTFYQQCPASACGRDLDVPHGICSFGRCICSLPWYGDDCEFEYLPPALKVVADAVAVEGQSYGESLQLLKGTAPVMWQLSVAPSGMTLDGAAVLWNSVIASAEPYAVEVKVFNAVGMSTASWHLTVEPSYTAQLYPVSPTVFSAPTRVLLSGFVAYREGVAGGGAQVPIAVDIVHQDFTRTIESVTLSKNRTHFAVIFYPTSYEKGHFQAVARHPAARTGAVPQSWDVLGMMFQPSGIYMSGETRGEIRELRPDATSLVNLASVTLSNITLEIPDHLSFMKSNVSFQNGSNFLETLGPGSSVPISLWIDAPHAFNAYFVIRARTELGTETTATVFLDYKYSLPNIEVQPGSLSMRVLRGKPSLAELSVTNTGKVTAEQVSITLPGGDLLYLVSFARNGSRQNDGAPPLSLAHGERATLMLSIAVPESQPLGEIAGSFYVASTETSTTVPFTIVVSSDQLLSVEVIVEDEYTYFVAGHPLVLNAVVLLNNPSRGVRLAMSTAEGNGTATFSNVTEDRYEVYVEAPRHVPYSGVAVFSDHNSQLIIFLQRIAVVYTWSVQMTTFKDEYIITLEADFETHVPEPVVTIEPREVKLDDLLLGVIEQIVFNITNHGLIRADNVQLMMPNHPSLVFTKIIDTIGNVEAMTSVLIPVNVSTTTRSKRATMITCYSAQMIYFYECGELRERSAFVAFIAEASTCTLTSETGGVSGGVSGGAYGGFYGLGGPPVGGSASVSMNAYVSTQIPCLEFIWNCGKALYQCAKKLVGASKELKADNQNRNKRQLPQNSTQHYPVAKRSLLSIIVPGWGCLIDVVSLARKDTITVEDTVDVIIGCACKLFPILKVLCTLYDVARSCLRDAPNKCLGSTKMTRGSAEEDSLAQLADSLRAIERQWDLAVEVFGDKEWLNVHDAKWLNYVFKPKIDDGSPGGILIMDIEYSDILAMPTPGNVSQAMVEQFLQRWNDTHSLWAAGITDSANHSNIIDYQRYSELTRAVVTDLKLAEEAGYSSLADMFQVAYNALEEKTEEKKGVCAVVRIKIDQKLTLTREAVKATLEITNQEASPLESIEVKITIKRHDNKSESNHLFSIGSPAVSGGLSSVSGDGRLEPTSSGSAEWLMVAYSEAAPMHDTQYDVSGLFSYMMGGSLVEIPLYPETITIAPDPRLTIHYFLERFVNSDDPMTDAVEPSVPFTLGVAVCNKGYGVATKLEITSGQPEIVSNKKGLLVKFQIIGATLGSEPMSSSLQVLFGDLQPFETKVARWWMTSSLLGEFNNYSATFQNKNPLGDPRLSVLDELKIHKLIRNVRIPDMEDDGLLDFLVDAQFDSRGLPDRLYNSKDLSYTDTSIGNVTDVRRTRSVGSTMDIFLTTYSNESGWVYVQYDTQLEKNVQATVISFTHGVRVLPKENAWVTSYVGSSDTQLGHLVFNFSQAGSADFYVQICLVQNCDPPGSTTATTNQVISSSSVNTTISTYSSTTAPLMGIFTNVNINPPKPESTNNTTSPTQTNAIPSNVTTATPMNSPMSNSTSNMTSATQTNAIPSNVTTATPMNSPMPNSTSNTTSPTQTDAIPSNVTTATPMNSPMSNSTSNMTSATQTNAIPSNVTTATPMNSPNSNSTSNTTSSTLTNAIPSNVTTATPMNSPMSNSISNTTSSTLTNAIPSNVTTATPMNSPMPNSTSNTTSSTLTNAIPSNVTIATPMNSPMPNSTSNTTSSTLTNAIPSNVTIATPMNSPLSNSTSDMTSATQIIAIPSNVTTATPMNSPMSNNTSNTTSSTQTNAIPSNVTATPMNSSMPNSTSNTTSSTQTNATSTMTPTTKTVIPDGASNTAASTSTNLSTLTSTPTTTTTATTTSTRSAVTSSQLQSVIPSKQASTTAQTQNPSNTSSAAGSTATHSTPATTNETQGASAPTGNGRKRLPDVTAVIVALLFSAVVAHYFS
ncbi:uncharacterized protein LOC144733868 [Lampetra planeri]